jgi:plastocyanin
MKSHLIIRLLAATAAVLLSTAGVQAQSWGTLSGTVKYEGNAPAPSKLAVNKDIEYCGKFPLVDESLLVGEDGGLKNVIVTLYLGRGDKPPQVHPGYAAGKKKPVVLNNTKCRFDPHVAIVQTGQTLEVGNLDAVGHNTKVDTFTNPPINPIVPAGGMLTHVFEAPERLPSKVSCSIHPWMTSWLVIRDDPYAAVTDEHGNFEIKNLPAGEWTFQLWHEKAGYLSSVVVNKKPAEWSRGRVAVKVASGTAENPTRLDFSVPAVAFK